MKDDSTTRVFGSFLLDRTEFAIGVEHLREVVRFPAQVTRMPLAPDHLLGFFNLRGAVIPLVDLRRLLACGGAPEVPPDQRKVAIVACGGALVGLLFDGTGDVLRVEGEAHDAFHYPGDGGSRVLSGVIRLEEGARLLQVVDPAALLQAGNIPRLLGHQNDGGHAARRHLGPRRKAISFFCGGSRLAFPIEGIHEIVKVPDLLRSVLTSPLCLGNIQIRERTMPLVDLSLLLGLSPSARTGDDARRVLVMETAEGALGLLADSVESIVSYFHDEVLPIPPLVQARSRLFQGCLPGGGAAADIGLLDHGEVLSHSEIAQIVQGHARLYRNEAASASAASAARSVYITFRLDHLYGIPIREVHEIISRPREIVAAPGAPDWVLGVLNLRGQLVTLLDARLLYGLPRPETPPPAAKVLLFRQNGETFGLLVDAVESILPVDAAAKVAVPPLLYRDMGPIREDLDEIIEVKAPGDARVNLLVIDPAALARRIGAAAQPA